MARSIRTVIDVRLTMTAGISRGAIARERIDPVDTHAAVLTLSVAGAFVDIDVTVVTRPARRTGAVMTVQVVGTGSAVMAGIGRAVVDVAVARWSAPTTGARARE
jgi:hypothetical protein